MPISRNLAVAAAVVLAAAVRARACAPEPVDTKGHPPQTVAQAIAKLKAEEGVDVKEGAFARCPGAGGAYSVSAGGEELGSVQAPSGDNPGAILVAVVRDLLKTPQRRLKALMKARAVLSADMELFAKEFGVKFNSRGALPLEERFPGKKVQRLMAYSEVCSTPGYSNSYGELGLVEVKVSEHIYGRADYPPAEVYKRGELGAAFAKAEGGKVYQAYLERVKLNAANCEVHSLAFDWKGLLSKLTKPAERAPADRSPAGSPPGEPNGRAP